MNAPITDRPATRKDGSGRGQGPAPGGVKLGQDNTRDGRRVAAAVLEVLAGMRTPGEAALALGVSVPRYYQVESRALRGFVEACEPRPRGRGPSLAKELTVLRQENQRLQRDMMRQQALVRAAQRSVGLTPPAPLPPAKSGKKPRKRRVARALSVATRLRSANPEAAASEASPPVQGTT
jgi:hypothetical protein